MRIEFNYNQETHLTIYTVRGKIDFHELLSSFKDAFTHSDQTLKCLWDFRYALGGQRISPQQIAQFYSLCIKYFNKISSRYFAFLVSENLGFGLGQVMSAYEELYDVYLNVRVFRCYDEALEWLNKGTNS